MTTLEKFLVKKQPSKTDPGTTQEDKPKATKDSELDSRISQLKGIFPQEPEENLMLLALQYQNPRDLEQAVQNMLESGTSFKPVNDGWNHVKSRDKKKPEPKKDFKKRRVEDENEGIPGYYSGKGKRGKRENDYQRQRGDNRRRDYREKEDGVREAENSRSIEETKRNTEEVRRQQAEVKEETPDIVEDRKEETAKQEQKDFPIIGEKDIWAESPPQEFAEKQDEPPEEENKLPTEVSEKILSPMNKGQERKDFIKRPEKREVGVQVEIDFGIPIIVYPYMFGKGNR